MTIYTRCTILFALFFSLNILAVVTHPLSHGTRDEDNQELNQGNTDSNSSNNIQVVREHVTELVQASVAVDLGFVKLGLSSTSFHHSSFAAGVGDDLGSGGGLVVPHGPVLVGLHTTAVHILLDEVPGGGEGFVAVSLVKLQPFLHVLGYLFLEVSLESEGCNAGTNLSDEDAEEKESVHVHHAFVLLAGSAASEEADDKDDTTKDNDEDRSVNIVVSQEVEVVLGLDLSISTKTNQDNTNEGKDEVTDYHEVFDETLAARLHNDDFI